MNIRLSSKAFEQLEKIRSYIARDNQEAAVSAIQKLLHAIDLLPQTPRIGRPGLVAGTRELVSPPYLIVYRIIGDVISVEAVIHSSQRYPP